MLITVLYGTTVNSEINVYVQDHDLPKILINFVTPLSHHELEMMVVKIREA